MNQHNELKALTSKIELLQLKRRKWRANHQIQVQHTKWVQALFHRAMTAASKLSVMIGCAKNSFLLPTILSTLGKYKTLF